MDDSRHRYPAALEIDYPDRPLDRLTTFFRPFMVVPIVVILALVSTATIHGDSKTYVIGAGGIVFVATLLMLLFRHKYPRWWFDWNVALVSFGMRVAAYIALLRDEYPSTDEEQAVHVGLAYPDAARDLNRWLPLIKWLLAFPHWIILFVLAIAAVLCIVAAGFAILFTGRYPRPLFDFIVGVFRWWLRVADYAFLLATDVYPPFTLRP